MESSLTQRHQANYAAPPAFVYNVMVYKQMHIKIYFIFINFIIKEIFIVNVYLESNDHLQKTCIRSLFAFTVFVSRPQKLVYHCDKCIISNLRILCKPISYKICMVDCNILTPRLVCTMVASAAA